MAKLEALLGLGSVSATLSNFSIRVHGQTVARFVALIALNDPLLNKQITLLSSSTLEFLETGSRHAGTSAWKSIRTLEGAVNRLPVSERESALYHLERYVQMLLARDPDLKLLIIKDIEEFRILRLKWLAEWNQ